jgi:hypothetical protein
MPQLKGVALGVKIWVANSENDKEGHGFYINGDTPSADHAKGLAAMGYKFANERQPEQQKALA